MTVSHKKRIKSGELLKGITLSQKFFCKSVVPSLSATDISELFQSEVDQNVRFAFCTACDQTADVKYAWQHTATIRLTDIYRT